MANKTKHTKTDPSDLKRRVWVIEQRYKGFIPEPRTAGWYVFSTLEGDTPETDVVLRCSHLPEQHTNRDFRYRAATLTFDDDGRKCVIY